MAGRTTSPMIGSGDSYTGPARPDIQTLLDGYRNLYPMLDAETFERLESGYTAHENKATVPVLSTRGNLVDGYHRLLIMVKEGRKVLGPDDFRIDYTAIDELSEMKSHVHLQENSRPSTSATSAEMARFVMRRYGWSIGKFADEFGFKEGTVKKWLQRNPDPAWDAEMAKGGRIGKDGKVYANVPEADAETPPKPKRTRDQQKPGAAVVTTVNRLTAEITNPDMAMWVIDHADADDREVLAHQFDTIAHSATAISESLRSIDDEHSEEQF